MSTPPRDEVPFPEEDDLTLPTKPVSVGPSTDRRPSDGAPPGYATEVVQVDDDDA